MKPYRTIPLLLAISLLFGSCAGAGTYNEESTHTLTSEHVHESEQAPTSESTSPESDSHEITAPETNAPETTAPETSAPETSASETSTPETSAPETSTPETSTPETSAPETGAPETSAPETTPPESEPVPHEHVWSAWTETTPATCEAAGEETQTCAGCGAKQARPLPALGHTYGAWTIYKEASCTVNGEERKTCTACEAFESRQLSPIGHTFGTWTVTTPATAEREGEEERACEHCGERQTRTLPMLSHTFTEWTVTTPATCTVGATETRTCTTCGAVQTKSGDPLGHELGDWATLIEPTCENQGIDRQSCSRCFEVNQRILPALGHIASEWITVVPATCVTEGLEIRKCEFCGDTLNEIEVPALMHRYGDWIETEPGTCISYAVETRTCTVCAFKQTRSGSRGMHGESFWREAISPGCEASGTDHRVCALCGGVLESRESEPIGHSYSAWRVDIPATCSENGNEWRSCARCGRVESNSIPMTGHAESEWIVDAEPSCLNEGIERRYCLNCSCVLAETRHDPLGHTWGAWQVEREPFCGNEGTEVSRCEVCDAKQYRSTASLEHTWGDWHVQAPTCSNTGYDERLCITCGQWERKNYTPATESHTWGEWYVVFEAEYCREGMEERICAVCRTRDYRNITTGQHLWGDPVTIEATCGREGRITKTCTICYQIEVEILPAVGEHTFTEYGLSSLPTCVDPGCYIRICTVCDTVEYAYTDPTGIHEYQGERTKEPTLTQTGLYTYTCIYCADSYTVNIPKLSSDSLGGDPYRILTSNNPRNYIQFSLEGSILRINGQLQIEGLRSIWLISDELPQDGTTIFHAAAGEPFSFEYDISSITVEGYLDLYTATATSGNGYTSYIWNEIKVKPGGDGYVFVHSPIIENNLDAAKHWLNPEDYLATDDYGYEITDRVRQLSDSIVAGETDPYQQMYLLNKWVAQNLYYDYDYYYGRKPELYYTPDEVAEHRYTVCEGYSRLLVALLRAQGIPALQVVTYSDGMGLSEDATRITGTNHAHVEAYLASEDRWVLMDPTWDSGNTYENATFVEKERAILYFDISHDLFAMTHLVMERGDWVSKQYA